MSFYKKLLLIDDDADDHEIFVEAVKEIDSSIVCTCLFDGEQGLNLLQKKDGVIPDLIFMDTNMPRISGKQLLTSIKQSADLNNIPIIMYSTFFSGKDLDEFIKLGAVHYLTKPSKFEELRSALNDILKKKW
jgi:CheY-like chemotaxis protein